MIVDAYYCVSFVPIGRCVTTTARAVQPQRLDLCVDVYVSTFFMIRSIPSCMTVLFVYVFSVATIHTNPHQTIIQLYLHRHLQ